MATSNLKDIRRRWSAARFLAGWVAAPAAQRGRVIGELDELAGAVDDPEFREALKLAADALEGLVLDPRSALLATLVGDLETLLEHTSLEP